MSIASRAGRPPVHATVTGKLQPLEKSYVVDVAGDGTYELTALPDGVYKVTALVDSRESLPHEANVSIGETATLDLSRDWRLLDQLAVEATI